MSQRDAIVGPGDIQLSCDMSDKDGAGRNTSIHRHPNHQQSCQKQASVGSSFFAISRRIAGYDDSLINGAGQTRQRQDLPRLLGSDAHADPDRRPFALPFRAFGITRSKMNPDICTICERSFQYVKKQRQITVDATILFADIRVSRIFRSASRRCS